LAVGEKGHLMSVRSLMNSKCSVYTMSTSVDSMGAINESYSTEPRLLDQPCRIQALTGNEQVQLGEEKVVAAFKIFFEGGVDVREKDKIQDIKKYNRVGALRSTDTNAYEVRLQDDSNRMGNHVTAWLTLREQNATRVSS